MVVPPNIAPYLISRDLLADDDTGELGLGDAISDAADAAGISEMNVVVTVTVTL